MNKEKELKQLLKNNQKIKEFCNDLRLDQLYGLLFDKDSKGNMIYVFLGNFNYCFKKSNNELYAFEKISDKKLEAMLETNRMIVDESIIESYKNHTLNVSEKYRQSTVRKAANLYKSMDCRPLKNRAI